MQSLVPLHNIGTTAHPLYEGTPLNIAALFVSFPVAVLVYGTAAYNFSFVDGSVITAYRPHQRSNQTMQRTATRSATTLSYDQNPSYFDWRSLSVAVADLVPR